MNPCQSLPAVLIVLTTVTSPPNGIWAQAHDGAPIFEAASSTQAIVAQKTVPVVEAGADDTSEVAKSNPFVPPSTSQVDTVKPAPTLPAKPLISDDFVDDLVEGPAVITEEIVTPIAEEVLLPKTPAVVPPVQAAQSQIFFDSPAPSYSDRRISKEKVTELRQQRALYRANQRVARMEYNQWMGHEPLRPRWSPMPMMNSRYAPPTIVVPVYIHSR